MKAFNDTDREKLTDIYHSLENTWSLITLDRLLQDATEIARRYTLEGVPNRLLKNLQQTRSKHFDPADTAKKKERRDFLIGDLKSNFRSDLLEYIAKDRD